MSTITLRLVEDHLMMANDSNGHSIVIGRSPDPQFQWMGVKPSDLLLMAVASCSAYDVVDILAKQREPLAGLQVICTGDQAPEPPWTFTHIHLKYIVTGAVKAQKLEKAIRLSEEKYCSVISSLRPGVQFSNEYEIVDRP